MGDVFDAMRRSLQQRGDKPRDADAAGAGPSGDETPALPIADVEAEKVEVELNVDSFAEPASVGAAVARSRVEQVVQKQTEGAGVVGAGAPVRVEPSLDGYSPQVIVHHDRGSVITEQYRAVRTQIMARCRNRRLQTHVITSSAPDEGKTVTTANLGIAFSELRSLKTLIIEGDLRRPSFHRLFDRKASPGLYHLLKGEVEDIDQAIHRTVYDNLQFMPAGDREFTGSTELLSSPRMVRILDRLKDRYDHIFIDTPPVITVTDPCILGAMSDETLMVVRLGKTPKEAVDRAKRLLRAANCEVAGVILTHMTYHVPRYLYRYV